MFFGLMKIIDSEGAILAHSFRLANLIIRKGTKLSKEHIDNLHKLRVKELVCAKLDQNDVNEDKAVTILSKTLFHSSLSFSKASKGRINIFSNFHGLLRYKKEKIIDYNLVNEGITLALLPYNSLVNTKQLIGTLKIIPYALPVRIINKLKKNFIKSSPVIKVNQIKFQTFGLIQTTFSSSKKSVIESTYKETLKRINNLNCSLIESLICKHEKIEITKSIDALVKKNVDIILIACASAVSDRRDVLPESINFSGGKIIHFGLPVDPGNLLILGELKKIPIIGMPGCARSPSINGFDLILRMILAGIKITKKEIAELSLGGLLKETKLRPTSRISIDK